MTPTPAPARSSRTLLVVGIVLALALVVALVVINHRPQPAPSAAPPPAAAETVVRLVGSNTVGSVLAPDLAEGFLHDQQAADVRRVPPGPVPPGGVVNVTGTPPGGTPVRFEIHAEGTETAFGALRTGDTVVGMASRQITPQEVAELAPRGDLTSRASEHVLALDAVAIIVPAGNPVTALSIDQLRDVFTCTTTDWSQLGGRPGPIHLFARDPRSGTFETFRDRVLAGRPLCASAKLFEDNGALSDAVAADPEAAIGFVALPSVGRNKALDLFDNGTPRTGPTAESISTESYLLTRRLYLYLPTRPVDDPLARRFVEAYALASPGQAIVARDGFLSPYVTPPPSAQPCSANLPPYCAVTDQAERVPFDVRFDSGTQQVDNRAFRNLDLLVDELRTPAEAGKQVLLVGFTDNAGNDDANLKLSQDRAESVRSYLTAHGVTAVRPVGFGEALPVDTNDTPQGREQNRRVEVWLH